jgi:hypothetical protein
MTDAFDARVTDALHALSGKERRHMTRPPFRKSFDAIADELREDENVDKLCGAVSASLGRGVLALAGDRLVFCGTRVGGSSWAFADIIDVDVRRGSFTLSSAVTLHVEGGKHVFALTCGRRPAAEFAEAVQAAVRHTETVQHTNNTAA